MAPPDARLGLGMLHALGPAHGCPVVLVLRGTKQTHLVVVAICTTTWPGEFVRAAPKHKNIHEFLRHECLLPGQTNASDAGPSSLEPVTLCRLLSCTLLQRSELKT